MTRYYYNEDESWENMTSPLVSNLTQNNELHNRSFRSRANNHRSSNQNLYPGNRMNRRKKSEKKRSFQSSNSRKDNADEITPLIERENEIYQVNDFMDDKLFFVDSNINSKKNSWKLKSSKSWNEGDKQTNKDDLFVDHGGGIISYGLCCFQCVRTNEVGIVEYFGEFQKLNEPGFYCIAWPFTRFAGRLSYRIQQLDVVCETKTRDNVFIHVSVAIQYQVLHDKAYEAFYRLTNPSSQIKSHVFDSIRSEFPNRDLDEAFRLKTNIASEIRKTLFEPLQYYGYELIDTLITNISPNDKVKASMNQINAALRYKEAIKYKAESDKIKKIKEAEAHCEALYLSGVGISNERKAIAKGLDASVNELESSSDSINRKDIMNVLLVTQYMDMIHSIGANNVLLLPEPEIIFDLKESINK